MISFLMESWFPAKRNGDFQAPDKWWILPRIIHWNNVYFRDNVKNDDIKNTEFNSFLFKDTIDKIEFE